MSKPTTNTTDSKSKPQKQGDDAAQTKTWDDRDDTSEQSFPASDAPESWAGRDIPPQERKSPKPS